MGGSFHRRARPEAAHLIRGELSTEPLRDPKTDPLLTPENCALALIDYRETQYGTVATATKDEINLNVVALCKFARAYGPPVIVATVGVGLRANDTTGKELMVELPEGTVEPLTR